MLQVRGPPVSVDVRFVDTVEDLIARPLHNDGALSRRGRAWETRWWGRRSRWTIIRADWNAVLAQLAEVACPPSDTHAGVAAAVLRQALAAVLTRAVGRAHASPKVLAAAGRAAGGRAVLVHPGARCHGKADGRTGLPTCHAIGTQLVALRIAGESIGVRPVADAAIPPLRRAGILRAKLANDSPGALAVGRSPALEAAAVPPAVRHSRRARAGCARTTCAHHATGALARVAPIVPC